MVAGGGIPDKAFPRSSCPGGAPEADARSSAPPNKQFTPMPSTHTSLHYHIVFSTKNREPWFSAEFLPKLHDQEEYVEFLKRGLVEYDERFLW